jgi:hypothetical protein
MVRVFDIALLKQIVSRDGCSIDINGFKGKNINRDSRIEFLCKCNQESSKSFRALHDRGAFCKTCIGEKSKEKSKETCLNKYGVDHPLKSEIIRSKIKNTNTERWC